MNIARVLRIWHAVVALLLALPGAAMAAGGCSAYMGQVVINEVRVGNSNAADAKNQVELYNSGGVAPAVWQTWSVQVWFQDGVKVPVKKGTYPMSTGHTANGLFIYNNVTKYWLQNRNIKKVDIAVLDANGDFVAYFAIEAVIQTVPACYGATTMVQSSGSGDETGGIMRPVDGTGAWPAALTKTGVHTIGRTNACTSGGGDLVVTMDPDSAKAIQNTTTVTITVTLFNNSCSTNVGGVKIATTNTNATYLASLATSPSAGSVAVSGSGHLWNVGTINAGVTATLAISGKPVSLGVLSVTSAVSLPASGLLNTGDDSDSGAITVQQFNYVGFDVDTDSVTEGTDLAYSASINLDLVTNKSVTVNYTVTGTAGAGDNNLAASGSVVIAAADTHSTIDFTITNDAIHEVTKTIVLTITSVTSTDATVKIGSVGAGYLLTDTLTLYDDDPLVVDHYELNLPSASLACVASTVSVTACADASSPCTNAATTVSGSTATLATNAGTLGATSVTFNGAGSASTTLSHSGAANGAVASVTLSGESTAAGNARKCCPNGAACSAANSCSSTFSTSGFIVSGNANGAAATVPTQTAGTASSGYYLRAVQTGTSTKACEAALTGVTTVNWAYQCNNPTTCATGNRMTLTGNSATTIAANPNSGVSSTLPVPMTFDANGNAPFSFNFADVGQVTLWASKSASGSLLTALSGSSNAFVVKPAGFTLSNIKCSSYSSGACATAAIANPGNNPAVAGPSASGTAFMPAGAAFTATVTAVDSGGNAVPNYGKETSPEGVKLTPTLVDPAGGTLGTLANSSAFGSFTSGVATGTTFSYSEAGFIKLTPSVGDGDYLGSGDVSGTLSANVGRFVPARFALSGGSVTHRSGLSCAPASAYTYLDENFKLTLTLTAQNSSGGTVTNYSGSYAKFVPGTAANWNLAGVAGSTPFTVAGGRLSLGSASGSWSNGVLSAATLTAAALRSSSADGPYSASFGVAPADSDGVAMGSFDIATTAPFSTPDRSSVASVALRFGRLRLTSGMGPADRALALPVAAQYWDGSTFSTNTLDSCTAVPTTAINYGSRRGTLTGADTAASGAIAISTGTGTLRLAAPGGGRSGTFDVALSLGSSATDSSCLQTWTPSPAASAGASLAFLRGAWCGASYGYDPAARASFGKSSGNNNLIFRRENY